MDDLEVRMMLGYLKEHGGDSSRAVDAPLEIKIRALRLYTSEHPADITAFDHLAHYYGDNAQYEECLEAFTRLFKLYPQSEWYRNRLAQTYYQLQRYNESIALCQPWHYSNVINLANMYYWRAQSHHMKGDLSAALKYARIAVRLNPRHGNSHLSLGFFLYKKNNFKKALQAYSITISRHPYIAHAYFNKACIYSMQGRLGLSLKYLILAIEKDDHFKESALEDQELQNLWKTAGFKKLMSRYGVGHEQIQLRDE
jgi:tetratricopeptide (TPR) repeat protein